MAFPENFLQELIERNDITDVVGGYVRLTKRSGSNQFGLCPFHSEKTPSFSVSADKQIYHCFGCGKGGGVINFIMEIESLSYPEAVEFLAKRVGSICVAYEGMERFFPADKITFSGNPIRKEIHEYSPEDRKEGLGFYGLSENKKHLLVVGGSLGSGTLNKSMKKWIESGCPGGEDVEVLWQCGKYYKQGVDEFMKGRELPGIHYSDFISRMDLAYACADLIISRSGASSISEICAARKAAIFVPSPNVAEDHQTHNAMALVSKDAAAMVKDSEAPDKLLREAMALIHDEERLHGMETNVAPLARLDAAQTIIDEVYKLV